MTSQLLAAALVAAVAFAGAAAAGPLDSRPGNPGGHSPVKVLVTVSSQGLDLTSEAGADRFLGRLTAAVKTACDDRPTDGPRLSMARTAGFNTCRRQALHAALTYVRSPMVKRRYAAMNPEGDLRLARR